MRASTAMETTVVSFFNHAHRACLGRKHRDFRDNDVVGLYSFFDEADMSS
jgi:hypothetical protein